MIMITIGITIPMIVVDIINGRYYCYACWYFITIIIIIIAAASCEL